MVHLIICYSMSVCVSDIFILVLNHVTLIRNVHYFVKVDDVQVNLDETSPICFKFKILINVIVNI